MIASLLIPFLIAVQDAQVSAARLATCTVSVWSNKTKYKVHNLGERADRIEIGQPVGEKIKIALDPKNIQHARQDIHSELFSGTLSVRAMLFSGGDATPSLQVALWYHEIPGMLSKRDAGSATAKFYFIEGEHELSLVPSKGNLSNALLECEMTK